MGFLTQHIRYAGLEAGAECYCGTQYTNWLYTAVGAADTDCNMRCGGNSSQMCGGGSRISIYDTVIMEYAKGVYILKDLCILRDKF